MYITCYIYYICTYCLPKRKHTFIHLCIINVFYSIHYIYDILYTIYYLLCILYCILQKLMHSNFWTCFTFGRRHVHLNCRATVSWLKMGPWGRLACTYPEICMLNQLEHISQVLVFFIIESFQHLVFFPPSFYSVFWNDFHPGLMNLLMMVFVWIEITYCK